MQVGNARRWYVALAAAAVVLASVTAEAQRRTSSTGSGIPVSKEPPMYPTPPRPPVIDTAAGEVVVTGPTSVNLPTGLNTWQLAMLQSFGDDNIVAYIAGDDSMEMRLAQLALVKATNDRVRQFARMIDDEHRAHLAATNALARDEDTGNRRSPNDTTVMFLARLRSQLETMPTGIAWDRTYMQYVLLDHKTQLLALNMLKDRARDDDLEELIVEEAIPLRQRHLDQGRLVAQSIGMTVYNGMR